MTDELVDLKWRRRGDVAVLKLNNPKVNSLSRTLREQFLEKLAVVRHSLPKLLVITGEGKGFSAGAHLPELAEVLKQGESATRQWLKEGHEFINLIASLPCTKIALIHCFAMAGGLELALACDTRIAVGEVKISLPEAKIKILPGWQGTIRTKKIMGEKAAEEFYQSGKELSVEEAMNFGLIDRSFADFSAAWNFITELSAERDSVSYADSAEEIENFIRKATPAQGEFVSPAITAIENFLRKP
ncbi:MAG: enoyl-CoA hydratase/isomerase family protein [bacterium]|nr:enoyl-CoA hydratase/isomerase family protein [bacterium]